MQGPPASRSADVLTPPPFIRVYHDPRNTCRSAAPGQVDIIPFEEYAARVVPAEMPALWPMEALKAQAIAVRTYAWYHILQARPDWDVSDWSNFQVMCDARHQRSDAAVAATEGQAIIFNGRPILAFYSAQNGHPTLDDPWGLPYIAPVPDPVSLGQPRSGHGLGLSQWGAKHWAERGWNAYQILAHYYPGTALSLPPDATAAVGTLLPLELEDMTLGRGYPLYVSLASPRPLVAITVTAQADTTSRVILTRTGKITSYLGAWIPSESFTSSHPITLTATVADISGTVSTLGPAFIWRDLRPLTLTLETVTRTADPRLPLTRTTQSPADVPLFLGVSDGWIWEERAFSVSPPDAGHVITDPGALDGWAWEHPRGAATAILYGPYTDALEPGRSYRAWFRLRVDDTSSPDIVVFLDVVEDDGQTLLGMRAVRGIEFPGDGIYREYPVDFHLFPREDGQPRRVEFRVHALGKVNLALDRVLVTTYPRAWGADSRWPMPQRDGPHALVVKGTTRSGVVAADIPLSVTLDMPALPIGFEPPHIAGWISRPITLVWTITTAVSPPDPATLLYRYARGNANWSDWRRAWVRVVSPREARLSIPASDLPDGHIRLQVRGEDTYTYRGVSQPITVPVDLHPPSIDTVVFPAPNPRGWYTRPITVIAVATDMGAGIQVLTISLRARPPAIPAHTVALADPTSILTYTTVITREGTYTLTLTARDALGREARDVRLLRVDLTRPRAFMVAPVWVGRLALKLFWGAQAEDVIAYDIDVRHEGEQWARWLENVRTTSAVYVGRPGERVAFRVRARDRAGWIGPWSAPTETQFPNLAFLSYLTRNSGQ